MSERPQARSDRLVIEAVGEELLVYDQSTQTAHSLSVAVRKVWERCDGQHTPSQLAGGLKLTPTIVEQALAELRECGLLAEDAQDGVSRRTVLRRTAKASGAVLIAAPLISTVLIPPATASASPVTCAIVGDGCVVFWEEPNCAGAITDDECSRSAGCTCQNLSTCEPGALIRFGTCG